MKKNTNLVPKDLLSIYITYVDNDSGKTRPVLVFQVEQSNFRVFRITSKYENKSEYIKKMYFPLQNWRRMGLTKPSWVDIGRVIELPITIFYEHIGRMSSQDLIELNKFIEQYYSVEDN